MSKWISIALSGFILIQSFQIGVEDILQLDELIAHAQFHQQEYGDSFMVFLSKHYGELKADHTKNHQEEQSDHEQLPFQCQGHGISLMAFFLDASLNHSYSFKDFNTVDSNFCYLNLYVSIHETELLQPPKHS